MNFRTFFRNAQYIQYIEVCMRTVKILRQIVKVKITHATILTHFTYYKWNIEEVKVQLSSVNSAFWNKNLTQK